MKVGVIGAGNVGAACVMALDLFRNPKVMECSQAEQQGSRWGMGAASMRAFRHLGFERGLLSYLEKTQLAHSAEALKKAGESVM